MHLEWAAHLMSMSLPFRTWTGAEDVHQVKRDRAWAPSFVQLMPTRTEKVVSQARVCPALLRAWRVHLLPVSEQSPGNRLQRGYGHKAPYLAPEQALRFCRRSSR